MSVTENLASVQEKIKQACDKANRKMDEITVIGVTKYVTIERTKELLAAGINNIGENRTDELLHKYEEIQDEANWHFIGTLQSRKVRDIIGKVSTIHSLDRSSVAKQINNRSEVPIDCFVQVNVSGEESKHGLSEEEVIPFIEKMEQYEKVRIVGLMTMAPHVDNENEIRTVFRRLATLRDSVADKNFAHAPCKFLSMGMSNDYEIAIEEGAT
ncbi:MAG TPA: YggS family pyridoxal phosphate-dependent enzyme, partial [Pseudogracilibacillus sp.]|nr:YggS family pyridoxal phosphate-dependent enzyme [Pseudogracilibacillus sp.]